VVSRDHPELLLDFVPSPEQVTKIGMLVTLAWQPIRDKWGPIEILSGIRPPALNAAVGGVSGSQHQEAEAGDGRPLRADPGDVYQWILDVLKWPGEVILYGDKGFIHVALPVIWVKADHKIV